MRSVALIQRLQSAAEAADFGVSDIAVWFDRPYHTVMRWLEGSTPYQNRHDVEARLLQLEEAIAMRMLPLPAHVKKNDRAISLRGIYSAVTSTSHRVSELHSTE